MARDFKRKVEGLRDIYGFETKYPPDMPAEERFCLMLRDGGGFAWLKANKELEKYLIHLRAVPLVQRAQRLYEEQMKRYRTEQNRNIRREKQAAIALLEEKRRISDKDLSEDDETCLRLDKKCLDRLAAMERETPEEQKRSANAQWESLLSQVDLFQHGIFSSLAGQTSYEDCGLFQLIPLAKDLQLRFPRTEIKDRAEVILDKDGITRADGKREVKFLYKLYPASRGGDGMVTKRAILALPGGEDMVRMMTTRKKQPFFEAMIRLLEMGYLVTCPYLSRSELY